MQTPKTITQITVSGIPIFIERKKIKNMNMTIYPSDGKVRVSAPLRASQKSIQIFIDSRIPWIEKHRKKFLSKEKESEKKYVDGEVFSFLGNKIFIKLHDSGKQSPWISKNGNQIDMYVRPKTSLKKKEELWKEFMRKELSIVLSELLAKWEPILQVHVKEFEIKQMKRSWGICYPKRKKIIFNLELINKSILHVEYVVVHELIHFFEIYHNKRFYHLMGTYLPDWKSLKKTIS